MEIVFKNFKIHVYKSKDISTHVEALGKLRIQVFKEWPYLYEGHLDYEKKYLSRYSNALNSLVALCFDRHQLIGATTAIDLDEEEESFKKPFIENKISVQDVMYFGESILLQPYRGNGIGQIFMDLRLNFARSFPQKKWAAFCSVIRPDSHILKPRDYKPLDPFWMKNGFTKNADLLTSYSWKDLNESIETKKQLQFWMKNLKESQ